MILSRLRRLLPHTSTDDRRQAARMLLPGPLSPKPRRAARALLEGQLQIPGFPPRDLEDGRIDWKGRPDDPRAYLRQVHGHAMLRDLVHAHIGSGRRMFLDRAFEVVTDWVELNPRERPANRMAWHDETTAMRVQTWLLLLDVAWTADHPAADWLQQRLAEHARLLASDEFHSTGTNHGMFQDEALLTYAATVREEQSDEYFDLATQRLVAYFDDMITPDGVHREHAPAYHYLIAAKIDRMAHFFAAAAADDTATRLASLRHQMSHYATHVIKPDGTLPLISDTFGHVTPKPGLFEEPAYAWAVSSGREGSEPDKLTAIFPEGGYAIFRSSWRHDSATYIHFAAAYHGDYHKHTDDLSVWLYHDGDLLTEAGPNGYDYDDPYTAYGYSAHAHNTLLVDGESLPRVDDRVHEVSLVDWDDKGASPWARGRNGRFDDVVHERTVSFAPDESRLVVEDRVRGLGRHRYTFLWNCAPGVEPRIDGDVVSLHRQGVAAARMRLASDVPLDVRRIHGDLEARRGFRLGGDEPVPTWVLELVTEPTSNVDLTLALDLG